MRLPKSALFLIAFIALAGIVNCTLLEPALAVQDAGIEESDHGCFICNASCHQGILPSFEQSPFGQQLSEKLNAVTTHLALDPLVRSIFHVPLAHS